jgi:glucose/arabinose dehydrogenase
MVRLSFDIHHFHQGGSMRRRVLALSGVFVVAVAGCGERDAAPAPGQDGRVGAAATAALPACDPDNGGLTLPDGFCALVVHEGVGPARHLAVGANGDVYVAIAPPRPSESREGRSALVGLRDTDGDGRADEVVRFGEEGGTGIALLDGHLYHAANTYVVRYALPQDGGLQPTTAPDTVVSGFIDQRSHAAKSLASDGAGNLWVNVGAPSNNCGGDTDRQRGARGQDPCPEFERQAGVWRFDAARTGQQQTDGERWAYGIRNAVALAFNPADRSLYAVQHGRDQLDVVDPANFDADFNAERPAEELLRLERGSTHAWPFCFYDLQQGRYVLAPEYGGTGQEVGRCAELREPVAVFGAHWAPNDLLFYTGEQFPERYRGGAFIAWHGSWNRAPQEQRGYKVTFTALGGGRAAAGGEEVFADGFAGPRPVAAPSDAEARPTGLAQGPDGSLYISDSVNGRIWRVVYTGGR